jgi:hypothetical protein
MPPSPHRRPIAAGIALLTATAALITGCSAQAEGPDGQGSPSTQFDHIHALPVEPEGEELTVATHEGIYRLEVGADGTATAVGPLGGLDFDPMGFTLVEGTAYASGHPGPKTPATFGAPNLGLITSTDRGETWSTVSLKDETDFHALAVLPAPEGSSDVRVFGLDTSTQAIRRSMDGGKTWTDGAELVARDLLALPSSDSLYATTEDGLAVSIDDASTFAVDAAAPALYLVGADPVMGTLAGVDVDGALWATNASGQWDKGELVDGVPQAFTVTAGRMYVADDRGIAMTDDLGSTWTIVELVSD